MDKWLKEHANEVIGLTGLLILATGCWAVRWWLAPIVVGTVLVFDSLRGGDKQ